MKRINKLVLIILITIILLPNNVFAKEEKPELKWKQKDFRSDTNYRGLEILCDANDGYITINNLGEIAKYDYDGKKVKTIVNGFYGNITKAAIDGDSLLIYYDVDNLLYKFSLNGELVFKKQFEDMSNFDIYDNGYFVITYNYVIGSYQIIKLDKEGNTISTYEINDDINSYMIDSNNNQIMIITKNNKSYLITMDLNFNIINEKEIKSQNIISGVSEFIEVEDGYLLISEEDFVKIDKEGNVILTNSKYEYNDIGVVSDGYIAIGIDGWSAMATPALIKFDKNGNIIYEEEYPSEYEGYDYYYFDKIITLSNDDYIIYCKIGNSTYQIFFGSIILKYGYKDYNITPNIKGEGDIDVSNTAKEGEKVTFKLTPDNNYELKSIKVVTVSGKVIEVTDNSFIMPNEDVIIEGEFVKTLTENPKTGNIIMIITVISLILILGTILVIYYKKKNRGV